jgi:DNA-binding Lrp family transcriptional regulator
LSGVSTIDAIILSNLLRDGRRSFADIAKDCGVTKSMISKRFKKLETKGIITGATVQINFAHLGFDALATLLVSVEAHQIEQVMEYIGKITKVRAYRQYNSVFNVRAVTTLKDLNELDHVKEAIRRHLPTVQLKTYIWTDVKNIPENLKLISDKESVIAADKTNSAAVDAYRSIETKIDELDMLIIEKLALDGRAPFNEIAQEIGTSTDTIIKRYQKLRRKGTLKISIQINPNKLGYQSLLDFNIAIASPGNLLGIAESLAKIPDVIIVTKTSGDYDLQLTAMTRSIEHMFTIQDEIARTRGVIKIESSARKIPNKWPSPKQYISTF